MDKYQRQNSKLEDKDQCLVKTPFGRGLVTRTRFCAYGKEENESKINFYYALSNSKYKQIQEIRLVNWSSGTLFSSNDYPTIEPEVGFDVISQFGRGIISDIIPSTQTENELPKNDGHQANSTDTKDIKYVITLTSWRLANRSLVKCYLNKKSFRVVRKKFKHEMSAYEKVSMGKSKKKEATQQFIQSDYNKALVLYSEAIGFVRYVQHNANSTNELRADLLELMVTCNNNAATCCMKLKQWQEAKRFAKNALVLLDALYGKRGMKIHSVLGKDGISDAKLFGEWKGKSLVIVAKALMNSKDYEQAIEWLKKAKDWIDPYVLTTNQNSETYNSTIQKSKEIFASSQSTLSSMEKEINRLLHTCMQRKKAVNEKEKKRAKAMFGTKSSAKTKDSISNANSSKLENNTNGANESKPTNNGSNNNDAQVKDDILASNQPFSILKTKSSSMESSNEPIRKVKFEGLKEIDDNNDDADDEPWYLEHKEALIVTGTVLALGASLFLRPRK